MWWCQWFPLDRPEIPPSTLKGLCAVHAYKVQPSSTISIVHATVCVIIPYFYAVFIAAMIVRFFTWPISCNFWRKHCPRISPIKCSLEMLVTEANPVSAQGHGGGNLENINEWKNILFPHLTVWYYLWPLILVSKFQHSSIKLPTFLSCFTMSGGKVAVVQVGFFSHRNEPLTPLIIKEIVKRFPTDIKEKETY